METNVKRLQRQQMILKFLGYYQGKCDGIWSAKTIAAKRAFELSGKFNPAYPNNGMPMDVDGPFPAGVIRDYKQKGFLTHVDIPADYYSRLESDLVDCELCADVEDKPEVFDPLLAVTSPSDIPPNSPTVVSQTTEQLIEEVNTDAEGDQTKTDNVIRPELKNQPSNQHRHHRDRR